MAHSAETMKCGIGRRLFNAALLGVTALGAVGLLAGCAPTSDATVNTGGTLRLAALGAGTSETLNPTVMDSQASIARAYQVFEPLVRMGTGDEIVEHVLAEELTPNEDGSVWTLKLRSGVKWHDGTPLTVDDVIYTMNYNVDNATYGSAVWSSINRDKVAKIDDLTVELPLTKPNFLFDELLVDINDLIIKDGTTSFEEPIGTGPFVFESFTPGQEATFERNGDYWGGAPALDAVEILSIDDDSARVNALLSGQVDAISGVPFTGIARLEDAGFPVANDQSGSWVGIRMNTTLEPFDDPRVREAMRLLIDREQIVSNAYGGNATLGNDVFGWFDPSYAELPQRTYDPARARELLAEAGYADLEITLPTTSLDAGTNQMVTLFAASAAAAGVTIKVKQEPVAEFYSTPSSELQWSPTSWSARPIATQINHQMSQRSLDAGLSETAWNNADFLSAYEAANAASDPAEQRKHLIEAQRHAAPAVVV